MRQQVTVRPQRCWPGQTGVMAALPGGIWMHRALAQEPATVGTEGEAGAWATRLWECQLLRHHTCPRGA